MLAIPHLHLLLIFFGNVFKSRHRLEAENLFLRHQLNIALLRAPHRLRLRGSDRALLVWMTRIWPSLLDLSQVVKQDRRLKIADFESVLNRTGRQERAVGRDAQGVPGEPGAREELRLSNVSPVLRR